MTDALTFAKASGGTFHLIRNRLSGPSRYKRTGSRLRVVTNKLIQADGLDGILLWDDQRGNEENELEGGSSSSNEENEPEGPQVRLRFFAHAARDAALAAEDGQRVEVVQRVAGSFEEVELRVGEAAATAWIMAKGEGEGEWNAAVRLPASAAAAAAALAPAAQLDHELELKRMCETAVHARKPSAASTSASASSRKSAKKSAGSSASAASEKPGEQVNIETMYAMIVAFMKEQRAGETAWEGLAVDAVMSKFSRYLKDCVKNAISYGVNNRNLMKRKNKLLFKEEKEEAEEEGGIEWEDV